MINPFSVRIRMANLRSGLAAVVLLAGTGFVAASPALTRDEVSATVLANGFRMVARAEPAKTDGDATHHDPAAWDVAAISQTWDVWAVKDGIAYRVRVDGSTGDLVRAAPAVEDD